MSQELARDIFKEFHKKRLFLLHKWDEDSEQALLQQAKQFYEENFSFRFGKLLRISTSAAIEKILVGLGKRDIDFVCKLLKEESTLETDIKLLIAQKVGHYLAADAGLIEDLKTRGGIEDGMAHALIELIKGKIENHISSEDFKLEPFEEHAADNDPFYKEFWSNRLYYSPSDNLVRTADIVYNKEKHQYYLVISANCDLNRFWHKNLGYINLIPAFNMSTEKDEIMNLLTITRTKAKAQKVFREYKQDSITGTIKVDQFIEGPIVLPFLDHLNTYQYLMLLPKAIESHKIIPINFPNLEPDIKRKKPLTYDQWENFSRVSTFSEPFASAIVQHCIKTISGYGAPNYPDIIIKSIKDDISGFINGEPN